MQTVILSLDLATTTGWAVLASGVTTSGAVSFARKKGRKGDPDEHPGVTYLRFYEWLRETIREVKPTTICFEEPMGNFKSAAARNVVVGLRGVSMALAASNGIELVGYPQPAVKKHATGKGNAKKPQMIEAAKAKWPDQEIWDDNQADALHVLALHMLCTVLPEEFRGKV